MPKLIDLTGKTFGLLTVENRAEDRVGKSNRQFVMWNCKCICGNKKVVSSNCLRSGKVKSCGCYMKELTSQRGKNAVKDLVGMKFGRLLVIERGKTPKGYNTAFWKCKCDCGNECVVDGSLLRKGRAVSCGCRKKEILANHVTNHMSKTRLFRVWSSMIYRCKHGKHYVDRGIKVCEEWKHFIPFRDWALSNGYDEDAAFGECTLDRIDNNGNYEPSNCRFVPFIVQENNKSNNHYITINDDTHTIAEWARIKNIPVSRIKSRLQRGVNEIDAVLLPKQNSWSNRR